jgi:UDP-glucose 4-epimerase
MKCLVTGSKGFIGTNLVLFLKSIGHEVFELDFPTDLTKPPIDIPNTSVVVHLAADTDVRKSIENPTETFLNNCKMTSNILESTLRKGARFIFTSSLYAESSRSPYLASKLACESLCKSYGESYGLDYSILRLSNIYGPHSLSKTSAIPRFIRSLLSKDYANVFGFGEQTRDFVYVDDVIDAICNCTGHLTSVLTGQFTSINSIIKMLRITKVKYLPQVKGEIFFPKAHSSPPYWECKTPLDVGLSKTLSWFEANFEKGICNNLKS